MAAIDSTTYTIPFAHVQLRGKSGALLKTRFAFVPAKYLCVFDVELLRLAALEQAAAQFGADSPGYRRVLKAMARAAE